MIEKTLQFYDQAERKLTETSAIISERPRLRWGTVAALFVGAALAPYLFPSSMLRLVIEVSIYAIFALSLNLLIGYTGLLSFGHAAFFGTPAYVAIYFMVNVTQSVWVIVPIAILITSVLALLIGYLSLQRHGIYFAMLTLALSQVAYVLAQNDFLGLTGGSDGMLSLDHADFGIPYVIELQLSTEQYFYLAVILLMAVYYVILRVVNSPFGSVLIAIRENEERIAFAGYNAMKYKLASFTFSAALCAISGLLFAFYYRAVAPERLFWLWSGEGVAMVILGGAGTVIGPILGAISLIGIREVFSPFLTEWTVALGVAFVAVMLLRAYRE